MTPDGLSMTQCKKRLGILWFSFSVVLFFVVFGQTVFGFYGEKVGEAWGWFLPTILPTLSLILGVLLVDRGGKAIQRKTVDPFPFWLSFSVSGVYLLVVALTIVAQVFLEFEAGLTLMKQSHIWLGPLQGLTSASIGAFFVKKKPA